jgi:hypothetical protein
VAPAVCFAGFIFIMFGIMFRSKKQDIGNNHNIQESQKN